MLPTPLHIQPSSLDGGHQVLREDPSQTHLRSRKAAGETRFSLLILTEHLQTHGGG